MGADIVYIGIVIIVIIISMTLHEAMHAFTSYWLGDDTARLQGRLTFNPIKHIDPFLTILLPLMLAITGAPIFGGAKPVPFNPNNLRFGEWGVALVAIAGPLVNLSIAFILFGASVVIGEPVGNAAALESFSGLILVLGVTVNLGFFVFNMIPIPPLDGSRVIYALAPEFVKRGMESIERFGIMIVFAIVLLAGSFISSFMSGAIKFFLDLFTNIFAI